MYKKVLVPLDGSKLAECTLPHVRKLASLGAVKEVLLLSIVESPSYWMTESIDAFQLQKDQMNGATAYIETVRSKLSAEGIKIKAEVMEGRAAVAIIDYAKEKNVDLILIATHGYSGLKQWVFGSVALRVVHDSHVPVLLIRPDEETCEDK